MELSQERIDQAVEAYNDVTQAHKRAPVLRYVHKQLAAGEAVRLSSGRKRWSSALEFAGSPSDVEINFVINPALPESFQEELEQMRDVFNSLLAQRTSA